MNRNPPDRTLGTLRAWALLAAVAVPPAAHAKKVICIDAPEDAALSCKEGYERARMAEGDVIMKGGSLTACLGAVMDGDELILITHGGPGSFDWGGMTYTGFGTGPGLMPVPPGFNTRRNVVARVCVCYSLTDPDGAGPGLPVCQSIVAAMGGTGNGNTWYGFVGTGGTAPIFELCGGSEEDRQRAANNLRNYRAWRSAPPTNRPGTGGPGQPPNQQTAAQAQIDAALGPNSGVRVKIPGQVGRYGSFGFPTIPGYPPPEDSGSLVTGLPSDCDCDGCDCVCFDWLNGGNPSIPTLNEWGLIVTATGLAGIGWFIIRRGVHL
jgi:hypothetical protein